MSTEGGGPAPPVLDGSFETDPPRLLGTRCAACDRVAFPPHGTCPYCGADRCRPVRLGPSGRLWAWTVVQTRPPGYDGPVPYGFGVVELPEGVRVVTRLTLPLTDARFGEPVTLRIVTLHPEGGAPFSTWEFIRTGAER